MKIVIEKDGPGAGNSQVVDPRRACSDLFLEFLPLPLQLDRFFKRSEEDTWRCTAAEWRKTVPVLAARIVVDAKVMKYSTEFDLDVSDLAFACGVDKDPVDIGIAAQKIAELPANDEDPHEIVRLCEALGNALLLAGEHR